jgi:hypothetical protein
MSENGAGGMTQVRIGEDGDYVTIERQIGVVAIMSQGDIDAEGVALFTPAECRQLSHALWAMADEIDNDRKATQGETQ